MFIPANSNALCVPPRPWTKDIDLTMRYAFFTQLEAGNSNYSGNWPGVSQRWSGGFFSLLLLLSSSFFFMLKLLQYCNYVIIVMQIKLMLLLLLL